MDTMTERTAQAISRYLRVRGYTILDRLTLDGTQVFVAEDAEHDALAFVQCMPTRTDEEDFAEPDMGSRSSLEHLALGWLADHECEDCTTIRFDACALLVVGEHRALLRHHRGAFNGCV